MKIVVCSSAGSFLDVQVVFLLSLFKIDWDKQFLQPAAVIMVLLLLPTDCVDALHVHRQADSWGKTNVFHTSASFRAPKTHQHSAVSLRQAANPFFKLLTMLMEFAGGPPGMPSFASYILQRIWEVKRHRHPVYSSISLFKSELSSSLAYLFLKCFFSPLNSEIKSSVCHQFILFPNNQSSLV